MGLYGDTDNRIGYGGFNQPYYAYASMVQVIPPIGTFPVSLAGHLYDTDTSFEAYRRESFHHKSLPAQRESINLTNIAGEGTVNTEGLWRREMSDWTMGSGQTYLDRKQDSIENRFQSSKGIDPWTPWQLKLQPALAVDRANYKKAIAIKGSVYYIDDSSVWRDNGTTFTQVTGITASAIVNDICTNGSYAYVATDKGIFEVKNTTATRYVNIGVLVNNKKTITGITADSGSHNLRGNNVFSGIYQGMPITAFTNKIPANTVVAGMSQNGNSMSINNPVGSLGIASGDAITFQVRKDAEVNNFYGVRYENGTLLAFASTTAGDNGYLFAWPQKPANIGGAVEGQDLLMDHADPSWIWTDATGGQSQLYFAGYSQNNKSSHVYRSSIQGPGVAGIAQPYTLNYPLECLPIPAGEYATSIKSYLNYIFVGTNNGIRMCQTLSQYDPTANAGGDLKAGPLIPSVSETVTQPVVSIVGHGRFVYFTWEGYDSTSSGLGRLDLSKFVQDIPLNPAYASDRMYDIASNTMTWLDWHPTKNVPIISTTTGTYIDDPTGKFVSSGYLNSGNISYGIPENKVSTYLAANSQTNGGIVELSLNADGGSYVLAGTNTDSTPGPDDFGTNQLRGELFNVKLKLTASNNQLTSPTVTRFTLKSYPAVATETNIMAVLLLYRQNLINGSEYAFDPYAEYIYLDNIRRNQSLVTYVEGPMSAHVIIDNLYWMPQQRQDIYTGGFQGDLIVSMKTVGGFLVTPLPTTVT